MDAETGLVYLRARYMDPSTGRFLTEDSFPGVLGMPQSQNRLAYAHDNPTNHTDPSGHLVPLVAAAALGAAGIAVAPAVITAILATVTAAVLLECLKLEGCREDLAFFLMWVVPAVGIGVTCGTWFSEALAPLMMAKGEYVPPGLTREQRNTYREAVHRYKDDYGLGPKESPGKDILDQLAEAIKEGASAYEAAGQADAPPEDDELDPKFWENR